MTARSFVELCCNEPGCAVSVTTNRRLVGNARAWVREAGWTTVRGRVRRRGADTTGTLDYCPMHGPGAPR